MALLLLASTTLASPPALLPLFEPGATTGPLSYPCFRQPELTPLGQGRLIAWTEV